MKNRFLKWIDKQIGALARAKQEAVTAKLRDQLDGEIRAFHRMKRLLNHETPPQAKQ